MSLFWNRRVAAAASQPRIRINHGRHDYSGYAENHHLTLDEVSTRDVVIREGLANACAIVPLFHIDQATTMTGASFFFTGEPIKNWRPGTSMNRWLT